MRKKPHSDSPDVQLPSDQDNSEDSFVFELFGDDDEEEDEGGEDLGFTLGDETPAPQDGHAPLNGAYSVSSTEEPGMVEDLGAPWPGRPRLPPSLRGHPPPIQRRGSWGASRCGR